MLMMRMHYECCNPKCKATDYTDAFPHDTTPPALNCWKCHAGQGKSYEQMVMLRQGMLPFKSERYETTGDPLPEAEKVVAMPSR